jgi:hypothetical protein
VTETFRFATSWREILATPNGRVEHDYARVYCWTEYGHALDKHRSACRGTWVTDVMVDPQVGSLIGEGGGRQRIIASGKDLWEDGRPTLTREEFAGLWRAFLNGEQVKDAA